MKLEEIWKLMKRIKVEVLGITFVIKVYREDARIYLQLFYFAPDTKTGGTDMWKSRKWILSEHMIADEVIKTAYAAVKMAVEHEVMEGFKVDGTTLFNPHTNFEEILKISHKEVKRDGA